MSIADEITRIKNNITNAYTACFNKGVSLPNIQNSENLANCINDIAVSNKIETEDITIIPATIQQFITPEKDGFGKITVNAVDSSIDENITADNIKSGISILGVSGNLIELKGQTKNITTNGTYTPDSGFNGITSINVNVPNVINQVESVGIPREVSDDGVFKRMDDIQYILPQNVQDIAATALYYAFANSPFCNAGSLSLLDMSSVKLISGEYAMYYACYYNSKLTTVNLSSLETISGNSALYYAFYSCGIENLDLSSLKTVSGNNALCMAFASCSLQSVDLSSLETVSGNSAFDNAFRFCRNLKYVNLNSLKYVTGTNAFNFAFDCCAIEDLYLPSLDKNAFGENGYTNQLKDIIYAVDNCTVHLPCYLKNTLANTSDVLSGFGGSGTTVLFDLHCATLTFTETNSNMQIYVDSALVQNNTCQATPDDSNYYLVKNTSNNSLYLYSIPNLEIDEERSIAVKLTGTPCKISLNTGISNLEVFFTIKGMQIQAAEEESTGNYYINLYTENNMEIEYSINGGYDYNDVTGNITINGNAITENITLETATLTDFTAPTLSSNGTLGGSSFAVSASSESRAAYYAFQSSSYWQPDEYEGATYIIYNPKPICVSQFKFVYWSSSYSPTNIKIEVSSDCINWTDLSENSLSKSSSQIITLEMKSFYKYYKFTFSGNTDRKIELERLYITAKYKG